MAPLTLQWQFISYLSFSSYFFNRFKTIKSHCYRYHSFLLVEALAKCKERATNIAIEIVEGAHRKQTRKEAWIKVIKQKRLRAIFL